MRRAALLACVLAAFAAGCTSAEPSSSSTPSAALRGFVLDGTAMLPCSSGGFDAFCGRLTVPEDRQDPSGRAIELEVVVVPAEDARPASDAVFFLTGGPGGASTDGWASAPSVFPALHADRDIVLVDQRGTGGSNPLLLPPTPDVAGLLPSERRNTLAAWLDDTLANLGADPRRYTSTEAAEDLDDVRAALGYDRIDLYGSSYGATLAQYYVKAYEEHVRTVVLDGGSLLDVPLAELIPRSSQEALDSVLARCRADAACHVVFPHPLADLQRATRRLDAHPVHVSAKESTAGTRLVLDGETLARQVHELIKTGQSGGVPRLLHLTAEGQTDALAGLVAAALGQPDVERLAMFWAVECSEPWAELRPDATARLGAGSYLLHPFLRDARSWQLACRLMPATPLTTGERDPVTSDVPVLLLNGSEDPQDPPANVADAPRELPNSLTVVVPAQGHTVGHLGCLPSIVGAFVDAGTVDGLDAGCVDQIPPPVFSLAAGDG